MELFDYIKGSFNYDKLYDTAYTATKNLDRIIDINFYPVIEAKLSNLKHRPIGLGIQGLADALVLLRIPFDSDQSIEFNKKMMETIYLAAITASNDISKERYDNLKKLYISELDQNIPEFYDPTFVLNNNNEIYHKLKLNGFELNIIKNFSEEKEYIGAYSTFEGSPFSQGQFQFDLW
jgi:ribonucleotide reductase alpha subunit